MAQVAPEYVTRIAYSDDLDVPAGWRRQPGGGEEVFVTRFARDGSVLKWGTYPGGANTDRNGDFGHPIRVRGNLVRVVGTTSSPDFQPWLLRSR